MPHNVILSVSESNAGGQLRIEGVIRDSEWDILQRFDTYSNDLLATKFVQDGMPSALKIKGSAEGPIAFETSLPNWDDVVLFLHYLRPIYLQSETATFHVTCNILAQRLEHPHIRAMIKHQRDIYSGKLFRTAVRISVDDTVVNSEEVLSVWLNSHEYHRDPGKRAFLDTLQQVLPIDASKVLFIGLLTEKVKAIAALSAFVGVVLGRQKSISSVFPLAD